MAEAVFHKLQFGRQTVVGTPVAATTIFPCTGTVIDLDRAYANPDEDYGELSDEQTGRGSFGVRGAELSLEADARFQDLMHPLEMHVAGGVVPSGIGPYTYTYTWDNTADTVKFYTAEDTDETQGWRGTGLVLDELTLGFDALSAPGNAPWRVGGSGLLLDRSATAATGSLTAPASMETLEGHLTQLYEGTTATAFASLTELSASLISFRLTSTANRVRRPYGGTSDVATAYGFSAKPGVTFEAMVKLGATSKTNIHDIYNTAGSVVQERRWRVKVTGSGTNTLTIDARVRFRSVNIGDRDGERTYLVNGSFVKDATLASRGQIILVNSVASIP